MGVMLGKKSVVTLNGYRDKTETFTLDSSSSSTVAFIPALSGVYRDLLTLVITNDSTTATIVSLTDNGSAGKVYKYAIAGNGGIVIPYPTPFPQTAPGVAWNVLNSAGVSLHYVALVVNR